MPKVKMNITCTAEEEITGPYAKEMEALIRAQYDSQIKELREMVRSTLASGGFTLQNVTFEVGE